MFDRALERTPRNKEVLVALATAVDRLGLFQEAVISCDQALEIDDQYPDAWFVKAWRCSGSHNILNQAIVTRCW
jgi:tetratricopeptide (TPR) repeat protein